MKENPKPSKKIWLIVVVAVLASLLLFYSIFSSVLLYIAINDEEKWDVFKNTFFTSSAKVADRDLDNVVAGTVELTIPKELVVLMGEDYDYTLTDEQKENGFTKVKKDDDGAAVFTIGKKEYDAFIKDLHTTTIEAIKEMGNTISEQGGSSIKSVSYSPNFEHIIIYVDKSKYNDGLDSIYISGLGLTSCMYQMFDIDAKGKCTLDITDKDTDEIIKTVIYPDDFN